MSEVFEEMSAVKKLFCMLLMCALLSAMGASAEEPIVVNPGSEAKTAAETAAMVDLITQEILRDESLLAARAGEITVSTEIIPCDWEEEPRQVYTLTHGGHTMRFLKDVRGNADENGLYPLYITLHGGGGATTEFNNGQWVSMFDYYRDSVENGIYLAVRGVSDTWDLHFQAATYPLLDALITDMVTAERADPNRVYLLGFSAGGDGVYQLAPRLADRFAAVSMSSGHPNGVSLLNLSNCPICLQTGIRDYYSEDAKRSVRCAEFEKTLSDYSQTYGFGYEHKVWIHVPEGHNFDDCAGYDDMTVLARPEAFAARADSEDMLSAMRQVAQEYLGTGDVGTLSYQLCGENEQFDAALTGLITETFGLETTAADTNAVRYVSQFIRDPAPAELVWDLGTRAASRETDSFYWLQADPSVNSGIIRASFDRDSNTYTVEPDGAVNGDFAIRFLAGMADTGRPVRIVTPKGEYTLQVNPSEEAIRESFTERMDPGMVCIGTILYSVLAIPGE